MPKTVQVQHNFEVPWEHTTTAFWCKYPNPELNHVKDALVVDRHVDQSGKLHTTRVIHIVQSVPSLLKKFSNGLDDFFAIEKSVVDPKNKSMKLETHNITFGSLVDAHETCEYVASPDGKSTLYTWSLTASCKKQFPMLTSQIESTLVNQAKQNSVKGLKAMENLSYEIFNFTKESARQTYESSATLLNRWPSLAGVTALSATDSNDSNENKNPTSQKRFTTANLMTCSLFK